MVHQKETDVDQSLPKKTKFCQRRPNFDKKDQILPKKTEVLTFFWSEELEKWRQKNAQRDQ